MGEPTLRTRSGGCACGRVRYTVRGDPTVVGICHCTSCRKATGSAFLAYADWPLNAFQTTGNAETYQGRSFCPTCGSRLFHLNAERVEINIGSLDDAPTRLAPREEGLIRRRKVWLLPVAGTEQQRYRELSPAARARSRWRPPKAEAKRLRP